MKIKPVAEGFALVSALKYRHFRGERVAFQGRGKGWWCGTANITPVLAMLPFFFFTAACKFCAVNLTTLLVFNLVMPEKHLFQAEVLLPKKQMLLGYGTVTVLL